MLGVGSEHGRGVDQAFWAGVEQPQPRPAWEEGPPDRLDAKGRLIWVGFIINYFIYCLFFTVVGLCHCVGFV